MISLCTALSTGTLVYLQQLRSRRNRVYARENSDVQELTKKHNTDAGLTRVMSRDGKDRPGPLQLVQVQVMFRHGARTPIYTLPNVPEVEYDPNILCRAHQASMFPCERVSWVDGSPLDWSQYEKIHSRRLLRGGASAGSLTGLGREQTYQLGQKLRDCYMQRLDISTFDPQNVRIMSSNIRRTVESAQSVLAGFYSKDHLLEYARKQSPVRIEIAEGDHSILTPDTHGCEVLKKNNHSAMVHPDFLPGFKEQRLEVEAHIKVVVVVVLVRVVVVVAAVVGVVVVSVVKAVAVAVVVAAAEVKVVIVEGSVAEGLTHWSQDLEVAVKPRKKLYEAVSQVQTRIEAALQNKETRTRHLRLNRHRQHYQYDPTLQPLFEERGRAIANVDRFWANVLNRDPALRDVITESDMKALIYLRNLEVEQFEGTLSSGYRIHFYFDKNPYFYNNHLCKEVFTKVGSTAPPSRETLIKWRPGWNLVEADLAHSVESGEKPQQQKDMQAAVDEATSSPKSFFHWFSQPSDSASDRIGCAIAGSNWRNPLASADIVPKVSDHWDKHLNFVAGRDDTTARVTHGLPYPQEVAKFRQRIDDNASSILYLSMAGQTQQSRQVVTRLAAGPLLTEMYDQAHKLVSGEKGLKLCLYSSHDSTMSSLMESLGIWNNEWPPFASDIRLELYRQEDGTDYFVRVLFNGKEQKVRGQTDSFVRWADFVESIRPYLIRREEQKAVCKSDILETIAQGYQYTNKRHPGLPLVGFC
ncbi:lysophosphatidic acid phosphatase type 6 [Elysia marginata]|uniref:2-phosphoxylose phosphatase 1 n=1 Tax=Elysia marginata TaxID=1093978 RepID=A0AAV4HZS8_9GAST|nr:lysophosphatidic acid phosphatase type 6 [Elysia marginata]